MKQSNAMHHLACSAVQNRGTRRFFGRHLLGKVISGALAILLVGGFSSAALAEKIDLNAADADTLQYIPGIGPGKSADIVLLREQTGGFKVMDDLLAVPGIGEKTLLDIKRYGAIGSGVATLTEEMAANPPVGKAAASHGGASDDG